MRGTKSLSELDIPASKVITIDLNAIGCKFPKNNMSLSRRLPVYLLIDCSESMAGPAFDAVQAGVNAIVNELSGDPTALETVWLSVITFSGRARVAVPLTDLMKFKTPRLTIGSGTCLGAALDCWYSG